MWGGYSQLGGRSPGLPRIAKGGRYLGRPGLATSSGLQRGRASCARWGWGAQQAQAWAQPEAELQGPGRREGRRGGLLGIAGITSRFRHRLNQRGRGRGARNALPGRVWRGKFSHAACGGPPSRVPGRQPDLDCSWGCYMLGRGSGRLLPQAHQVGCALGLKSGAWMLPGVSKGHTQGMETKPSWWLWGVPKAAVCSSRQDWDQV